jgi:ketosteroid isomerase-like protein
VLSAADADAFARSWFEAWNRHNLDAILQHYADDIEHSSPFIVRYNGDPSCAPLKGKAAVGAYFGRALQRNPTLRFEPMHVAAGVDSVALVYRRMTGEIAVETFAIHGGLIRRSVSHYAP